MHNEITLMTLILVVGDAIIATFSIFITCELGQQGSDAFEGILDVFEKLNWHRFPNEIQRLLPMILASMQTPVELEVFGSITCCRYVMKSVG